MISPDERFKQQQIDWVLEGLIEFTGRIDRLGGLEYDWTPKGQVYLQKRAQKILADIGYAEFAEPMLPPVVEPDLEDELRRAVALANAAHEQEIARRNRAVKIIDGFFVLGLIVLAVVIL